VTQLFTTRYTPIFSAVSRWVLHAKWAQTVADEHTRHVAEKATPRTVLLRGWGAHYPIKGDLLS
jgi:hypothetical protein